jgi:cytochrome P450
MMKPKVPGPRGRLFVGSALEFSADPIGWMRDTRAQYGDIVRLDPTTVVVHDPEVIHQVLVGTNDEFLLDNAMVAGSRGREWLLQGLPQWMETRRYIQQGLARSVLMAHLPRARRWLIEEAERLAGVRGQLFDTAQRLVGGAITDYCVGSDPQATLAVERAVEAVFWASLEVTDSAESRLRISRRPIAKRAQALNNVLVEILTDVVRDRRARRNAAEPGDALDALIARGLPESFLVAAIRLLLVSSRGPSGATLSWYLLRLAERSHDRARVREEVQADSGGLPGENWPHTTAMFKEVIRLHPPNWLMGRTCARPVRLAGYPLRANDRVLFTPYLVHRDPRFWPDPDTFDPLRWQSRQIPYTGKAYLPFGAGTRVCPGTRLGSIQLTMTVAAIIGRYKLELPPIESVTPAHSTLLTPDNVEVCWK